MNIRQLTLLFGSVAFFIVALGSVLGVVAARLYELPEDAREAATLRCIEESATARERAVIFNLPFPEKGRMLVGHFTCSSMRAALDLMADYLPEHRAHVYNSLEASISKAPPGGAWSDQSQAEERTRLALVLKNARD